MTSANPPVVTLDIHDNGVAVVRIHRPEVKNALNAQVRETLAEHFRALGFSKVYNVNGGIVAWADLDPAVTRY